MSSRQLGKEEQVGKQICEIMYKTVDTVGNDLSANSLTQDNQNEIEFLPNHVAHLKLK